MVAGTTKFCLEQELLGYFSRSRSRDVTPGAEPGRGRDKKIPIQGFGAGAGAARDGHFLRGRSQSIRF